MVQFHHCFCIIMANLHPPVVQGQRLISGIPAWLYFFGAYGPFVAAILVIALLRDLAGLKELLSQVTRWRSGKHPGKLLPIIRLAALSQILVLGLFSIIVYTGSGLVFEHLFDASRVAVWF